MATCVACSELLLLLGMSLVQRLQYSDGLANKACKCLTRIRVPACTGSEESYLQEGIFPKLGCVRTSKFVSVYHVPPFSVNIVRPWAGTPVIM
jgi:hypothetical protein